MCVYSNYHTPHLGLTEKTLQNADKVEGTGAQQFFFCPGATLHVNPALPVCLKRALWAEFFFFLNIMFLYMKQYILMSMKKMF